MKHGEFGQIRFPLSIRCYIICWVYLHSVCHNLRTTVSSHLSSDPPPLYELCCMHTIKVSQRVQAVLLCEILKTWMLWANIVFLFYKMTESTVAPVKASRKSSMKCVHRLSTAEYDPCLTLGIIECTPLTVETEVEPVISGVVTSTYHNSREFDTTVSLLSIFNLINNNVVIWRPSRWSSVMFNENNKIL